MSDSPYKPPHLPPGGGHAPIPSVPVASRRRGAIPAAPVQLPRRPIETDDETPTDQRAWAFAYRGNVGEARGEEEESDYATAFRPAVELAQAEPLTVLFYQDTQVPQNPNEATSQIFSDYLFDGTSTGDGDLDLDRFRLNESGAEQIDSTIIYIAIPNTDGNLKDFLERNTGHEIELRYGASSFLHFTIDDWERQGPDAGVYYLVLDVTLTDSSIDGGDGPIEDAEAVEIEVSGFAISNAAVRARVRYRNGKSEVQFDCDWAGGFQVLADRLELSRVRFAPDTSIPYADGAIDIAATVLADAPRPGGSLQLTVAPVAVPTPTGDRFMAFPIHSFARRVNLILKYGNDEDAPGDVPLGQIFLAFVGKYNRSLCYIDAMAAREALFGAGLPVPSGVSMLVVSNRSDDDSMQIGVVWRLEL